MPFAERDVKLLWGLAGGYCSNPTCRDKVAIGNDNGKSFLTGENAHIIARQAKGPRGDGVGGDNSYENLILLCPTCHTKIDKSPDDYSPDLLFQWKAEHEKWVDSWSETIKYNSTAELMQQISKLLAENEYYFKEHGPKSENAQSDPSSSGYTIWVARRLDVILPNNRKILAALEENSELIPQEMISSVMKFKDHAKGYEQNTYERVDRYTLFPNDFRKQVEGHKSNA